MKFRSMPSTTSYPSDGIMNYGIKVEQGEVVDGGYGRGRGGGGRRVSTGVSAENKGEGF